MVSALFFNLISQSTKTLPQVPTWGFFDGGALVRDEHYMDLALQLAELGRGQTTPNPMVGAVIVKDNRIIGQGAHLKAGEPHAEIHALRMAGDAAQGATLYVTLEPCSHHGRTPPCAEAIVRAGVSRVVIAMEDRNPLVRGHGVEKLKSAGIQVIVGVRSAQAYRLNEVFFTWASQRRPFVVWKCAATMDGYIAAMSGDSKWVTGEDARSSVQQLRADLPAIAVGIGTVLADNPRLTVRDTVSEQPLRVIFDSKLRFPLSATMRREPGSTLIYTALSQEEISQTELAQKDSPGHHKIRLGDSDNPSLEIASIPRDESGRVSVPAAMSDLALRNVTGILLEGGSTLVAEFLKHRLIDKVVYYIAPKLLGGGIPALSSLSPEHMRDAIGLRDVSWSLVGSDFRVEGYPDWR